MLVHGKRFDLVKDQYRRGLLWYVLKIERREHIFSRLLQHWETMNVQPLRSQVLFNVRPWEPNAFLDQLGKGILLFLHKNRLLHNKTKTHLFFVSENQCRAKRKRGKPECD